jgi:predicted transcriptional regulator
MKAVLISIRPQWCELIASGKKTVEVRKTKPKLETPFKVFIYCTADTVKHIVFDEYGCRQIELVPQRVIGEFVCDKIFEIATDFNVHDELPGSPVETWLTWEEAPEEYDTTEALEKATCLSLDEISSYMGAADCAYGWHISNLQIYDKPKPLSEFRRPCDNELYCEECGMYSENRNRCGNGALQLTRPPQSWCYVEELK